MDQWRLEGGIESDKVVVHHIIISALLPVSQSQDKQLQKGRVYEQVLIVALQLGEAGQPVSPAPRGLHRDGEQPVEELDVLGV